MSRNYASWPRNSSREKKNVCPQNSKTLFHRHSLPRHEPRYPGTPTHPIRIINRRYVNSLGQGWPQGWPIKINAHKLFLIRAKLNFLRLGQKKIKSPPGFLLQLKFSDFFLLFFLHPFNTTRTQGMFITLIIHLLIITQRVILSFDLIIFLHCGCLRVIKA